MTREITSIHNPEIKQVAALCDSKERYLQKRFIAEGLKTIETIVKTLQPLQIYVSPRMQGSVKHFAAYDIIYVSDGVMNKISQSVTPSGILAIFPLEKKPIKKLTEGIVLADITDPGNMGTLIRTCAAMGKKTVCCIEGTDPWSVKVVQASAGTIVGLTIMQGTWKDFIAESMSMHKAALVASGGIGLQYIQKNNTLLIIGNESKGIKKEWLTDCDTQYTIPMPGKTESLNAAIAGSIAMYIAWYSE